VAPGGGDSLSPEAIVRLQHLLAVAAGSLDVFCLARLGGSFASVITGNLVVLGGAASSGDLRLVASAAGAVGGYAAGVAAGAGALRGVAPGWRTRTTCTVALELVLLLGVAVAWLASPGRALDADPAALLTLAGAAMGVQSAVTVNSGLRGAATTYLTGTLTVAVAGIVATPHGLRRGAQPLLRLASLLAGAFLGGVANHVVPAWTPLLPVALVALVLGQAVMRRPRA
jgi:uncharacterized membrane protein YoaK (UPF0700 family)